MTDIAKIVADRHQMLADFAANRAEIAKRPVDNANYMLIWKFEGSSLFVGRRPKALDVGATGFGWAITFRDFDSAARYVRRTNIRNGKGDQPLPIKVTDAREIALADVDGVINTLKAMEA
jgi:hypothetical protein